MRILLPIAVAGRVALEYFSEGEVCGGVRGGKPLLCNDRFEHDQLYYIRCKERLQWEVGT
jgi:hypothetical protein